MIIYLKAQTTAILGSLVDFLITFILFKKLHYNIVLANLIGNICGAITQFVLSRNWAFKAGDGKISLQIVKYILVWVGNLALSAGGVYFFADCLHVDGILSKIITSVILGLTYNYIMQKKFVFAK
ncbi:MAG TPA: GtrA family protein [Puia sp.]